MSSGQGRGGRFPKKAGGDLDGARKGKRLCSPTTARESFGAVKVEASHESWNLTSNLT